MNKEIWMMALKFDDEIIFPKFLRKYALLG